MNFFLGLEVPRLFRYCKFETLSNWNTNHDYRFSWKSIFSLFSEFISWQKSVLVLLMCCGGGGGGGEFCPIYPFIEGIELPRVLMYVGVSMRKSSSFLVPAFLNQGLKVLSPVTMGLNIPALSSPIPFPTQDRVILCAPGSGVQFLLYFCQLSISL